jgi:membrane-bound lytic murein transglycosylase D
MAAPHARIARRFVAVLLAAVTWPVATQAESFPASVGEQIRRFTRSNAGFTQRGMRRARGYLPMIREELWRHGLPAELAWLPLVESGFRPDARSPAGAVGLWQLMPQTARRFGLRVDGVRDERLDPLRSTHAAAAYLAFLARTFQSWPLVLAAYNAGEGRIGRLIAAAEVGDFWALAATGGLPEETREFVPAAIALSIICEQEHPGPR